MLVQSCNGNGLLEIRDQVFGTIHPYKTLIIDAVKGRCVDGIFVFLGHTHEMVPFMPPFSGTEQEREIMSRFLYQLANGKITIKAPSRFAPIKEDKRK